jgi:hypothetical protein
MDEPCGQVVSFWFHLTDLCRQVVSFWCWAGKGTGLDNIMN